MERHIPPPEREVITVTDVLPAELFKAPERYHDALRRTLADVPVVVFTRAPECRDDPDPRDLVITRVVIEWGTAEQPTPVHVPELRRADSDRGADRSADPGVRVDRVERVVRLDGRELELTYTTFELLSHLVDNPYRVHSRDRLLDSIWGYTDGYSRRTVDAHIARLRRELGPKHRDSIVTVRGVGYKYVPRRQAAVAGAGAAARSGGPCE